MNNSFTKSSMKTLVHRDCHYLPKTHLGAIYPYTEAKRQGYEGNTGNAPITQQGNSRAPKGQDQSNQGRDNDEGYVPSKGHITAMIQPVPKSNKEEKSITRQVNLAITYLQQQRNIYIGQSNP
jgi:hypothetical protein